MIRIIPTSRPAPHSAEITAVAYDPAMKLDVLQEEPWYSDGLKFTCTQCGNCCTGGPGFVWITEQEIERLAEFLKLTARQVLNRFCRKIGSRWSLKERRTSDGLYDCVFLTEQPEPHPRPRQLSKGQPVPLRKRGCSIYPVRPLQCRTWPFWDSNLSSEQAWERASRRCPGMGRGPASSPAPRSSRCATPPTGPTIPPLQRKPLRPIKCDER